MIGPIDYRMQVLDPIQAALQQRGLRFAEEQQVRAGDQQDVALGQGQQRIDLAQQQFSFQQQQAAMAQQQQAQAEAQARAGQQAFIEFMAKPNKTADDAFALMRANPEMAVQIDQYWSGLNEQRKAADIAFGKQAAFALNNAPEQAKSLFDQRAEAADAAGDAPLAATYRAQSKMMEAGPDGVEAVKAQVLAVLAGALDPKDLQAVMTASGYGDPSEPASVQALRIRAQEAGLQPGTPEYERFMVEGGGGPQVVVNTGDKAGAAFETEIAKQQATMFQGLVSEAAPAKRSLGQISQLSQLLESTPSGAVAALQRRLGEYGINTEGLSEIQTFEAIINQLVPLQRQPGSGPMSDRDLELFKQSLPRLINQPGGNRKILDTMKGIAEYQVKQAEIAEKVVTGEIERGEGVKRLMALKNPLGEGGSTLEAAQRKLTDAMRQKGARLTPDEIRNLLTPEELQAIARE